MSSKGRLQPATSLDTLFGGAVSIRQPRTGYRVNADAILLAAFAARGRRADLAIDLGSGVGGVALSLHHLGAARRFVLIDRDSALVALARDNLARAEAPGECVTLDLERGSWPRELRQAADLVTANPPFFEPARARCSPHPGRNRARFGRLEPFLTAAALALDGARARAAFVYPARALAELLNTAHGEGLVAKRLRFVHARADSPARLALVELRLARPGGLEVEAPLVEWSAPSVRSPELSALLGAKTSDRK